MAESYDDIDAEPFYANQYKAYRQMFQRHISRRLENALDLGCGTGIFTKLLAAHSNRVVGIDIAPGLLAKARANCVKHGNIELLECSATALPFASCQFDAVVSFGETISHVRDYRQAFAEVCRVLRPNGLFLFSVINKWCLRLLFSGPELYAAIRAKGGHWRVWGCEDDAGRKTELALKSFTHPEIVGLTAERGMRICDSRGIHVASLLVPLKLQKRPRSWSARLFSCLGRVDERMARRKPFSQLGYTCMYATRKAATQR